MTKAQKEEKARNERKLQQMLAAGIKIGPQEGEGEEKKKKVVYDNRKRGKGGQNKVCEKREDTQASSCLQDALLTWLQDRRGEGAGRGCRAGQEAGRAGSEGGRGEGRPRKGRGRGCC